MGEAKRRREAVARGEQDPGREGVKSKGRRGLKAEQADIVLQRQIAKAKKDLKRDAALGTARIR